MRRHNHYRYPALIIVVPLLAGVGGCAKEEELTEICEYVKDPMGCFATAGETGGDPEPIDLPPCTLSDDSHPRTVYQCNGEFSASLSFTTLLGDCGKTLGDPSWCTEVHAFGAFIEPYEMPAVMACCDPDAPPSQDDLLLYCSLDLIEQLCRSVTTRLQNLVDDGAFPVGKNQAQELHNWLAENQQSCYDAFHQLTDVSGVLGQASWLVNGGKNGKWPSLNDFTITLEYAHVDAATLPKDPAEYLSCGDNDFNNTEIFEDEGSTPAIDTITYLVDSPIATLTGPKLFGEQVFANGRFTSLAGGCVDPWCSSLEITADPGWWTLDELELFGDQPLKMTNGSLSLMVDRTAIRLYGRAVGTVPIDDDDAHDLQPGVAHFLISGVGDGPVYDLRWASNSSSIKVHEHDSGWLVDGFTIEHVDREGETWTLAVPQTIWSP